MTDSDFCEADAGGAYAAGRKAGIILPAVLMLLALLTVLTLQAQMAARQRLALEMRAAEYTRMRALATDAAWHALRGLAEEYDGVMTHTNADWAVPREINLPDGTLIRTHIRDSTGLFNINNFGDVTLATDAVRQPRDIAVELLEYAGSEEPTAPAERMHDWFAVLQPGDTSVWVQSTAELVALAPEAPAERLLELFSVLPPDGIRLVPVNVNTAPEEVIRAVLGRPRAWAAEALINRRDAQPLAALEHFAGWPAIEDCAAYLDVRGRFFEADVQVESGENRFTLWVQAACDAEGKLHVHRWVCY